MFVIERERESRRCFISSTLNNTSPFASLPHLKSFSCCEWRNLTSDQIWQAVRSPPSLSSLFVIHFTCDGWVCGRVLLDDTDMFARVGGGGYEWYGIDRTRGTIVVVRPDGYVGMMAPFEKVEDIEAYFAGFLKG